ncbi:MAG: adenylyltransferase/cytidyltransferase family protein [Alkalispirochaetaceae bacterium]
MNGVIIGRFMPPHRGHQYLVEFAHNYVDELYVLVCTLTSEPIPGELRYQWMRELFPRDTIIHITEEIPEASRGMPKAEAIWARSVREAVAAPIDHVFASESYGAPLAEALSATYVPVDPAREIFPVSATLIRQDPYACWEFIPEVVRPYFTRRCCVVAHSRALHPAAQLLAKQLETVFVNDYGRFVATGSAGSSAKRGEGGGVDILRAQAAAEEALARHARGVLFCERGEATYEELSRYDMILAEESEATPPRMEESYSRLSREGTPVLRFSELSEGALSQMRNAVEVTLLNR